MIKKKITKIALLSILLVAMLFSFSACSFNYGDPDILNIGDMNIGQRVILGLQVAALGIVMVFMVLAVLILVINLMQYFNIALEKKLQAKQSSDQAQEELSKLQTIQSQQTDINQEDEQVIAVIMASINMFYDTQEVAYKSTLKFKVRSIKQIK